MSFIQKFIEKEDDRENLFIAVCNWDFYIDVNENPNGIPNDVLDSVIFKMVSPLDNDPEYPLQIVFCSLKEESVFNYFKVRIHFNHLIRFIVKNPDFSVFKKLPEKIINEIMNTGMWSTDTEGEGAALKFLKNNRNWFDYLLLLLDPEDEEEWCCLIEGV